MTCWHQAVAAGKRDECREQLEPHAPALGRSEQQLPGSEQKSKTAKLRILVHGDAQWKGSGTDVALNLILRS